MWYVCGVGVCFVCANVGSVCVLYVCACVVCMYGICVFCVWCVGYVYVCGGGVFVCVCVCVCKYVFTYHTDSAIKKYLGKKSKSV